MIIIIIITEAATTTILKTKNIREHNPRSQSVGYTADISRPLELARTIRTSRNVNEKDARFIVKASPSCKTFVTSQIVFCILSTVQW
jgi:hypothetical protein